MPPPPEFQLCRELSEVCESVETSSSVEAMEIEAMETPPRAATPKRSLPVTFRLDNAKKQKTDFDADAEPDHVIKVFQYGVKVGDRLIRPATVVVSM